MDIVELKHQLNQITHNILCEYNQISCEKLEIQETSAATNRELHNMNESLINANKSKDSIIETLEKQNQGHIKQCHEYSELIIQLQEENELLKINKEEENRFDIIRKQANEIHHKDNEIKHLELTIQKLKDKHKSPIDATIEQVQKTLSVKEDKVEVQEEPVTEEPVTEEEVEEEEKEEPVTEEVKEEPLEEEVKEEPVTEEVKVEEDEEVKEEKEEKEEEVEEEEVDVITYRKKEYYTIEKENPQYIYAILEDNEMGDKVGEYVINQRGNKVVKMYK